MDPAHWLLIGAGSLATVFAAGGWVGWWIRGLVERTAQAEQEAEEAKGAATATRDAAAAVATGADRRARALAGGLDPLAARVLLGGGAAAAPGPGADRAAGPG